VDGLLRLAPADAAFASQLHDLSKNSIAMIEQRLKDSASSSPAVQPDGADRIRIFLPGVMEPERVTAVSCQEGYGSASAWSTPRCRRSRRSLGAPPASSEVLFGFKDQRPYLVATGARTSHSAQLQARTRIGSPRLPVAMGGDEARAASQPDRGAGP